MTTRRYHPMDNINSDCESPGISRHEYAAIQAMNGILSASSDEDGMWSYGNATAVAAEAVLMAGALFDELEKAAK